MKVEDAHMAESIQLTLFDLEPIRLTHQQMQLAAGNMRLAYHEVNKQRRRHPTLRLIPLDELNGIALYALCKAAKKFDPYAGYRFSTYACTVIKHDIQRASLQAGVVRLPASYCYPDTPEEDVKIAERLLATTTIEESLAADTRRCDPAEEMDARERRLRLRRHIARLPQPYRLAVKMHYLHRSALTAIAARLGVKRKEADRLLADGLRLLKRRLLQDGWGGWWYEQE